MGKGKQWCTYGSVPMLDVGRVEVGDDGPRIRYSEGQLYDLESWDAKYVRRFATPEGAIAHASWWNSDSPGALRLFRQRFPSIKVRVAEVNRLVDKAEGP